MTTRIGVLGAGGRMGRALIAAIEAQAGAEFAGGVDRADHPEFGGDLANLAHSSGVLVDFTAPSALAANLAAAAEAGRPILVGTTGLTSDHHAAIDVAASRIAILQAANTSLGVNLLAALVEQAAARLGPEWDIEIVEMHHRMKADAPSGTALLLGEAAARGRNVRLDDRRAVDRDHVRREGDIGFASLRGGSVPGDHRVLLAGDGEQLELAHRAETRDIFARGAIRSALWLAGRPPGRYTMRDVLEL